VTTEVAMRHKPGRFLLDADVDPFTLRLVAQWIFDNQGTGDLPDDDRVTTFGIDLEKAASRIERAARKNAPPVAGCARGL